MRTRKLIMYILDQDTGAHIDSVVYIGEFVEAAVQAAQAITNTAWANLSKKRKEVAKVSGYLVQEFPELFQAVKKDTEYLAFCTVLVPAKAAATA